MKPKDQRIQGGDAAYCGVNIVRPVTRGALFGAVLVAFGVAVYVGGALLGVVRILFGDPLWLRQINGFIVWYSAMPVVVGLAAITYDLAFTVRAKRSHKRVRYDEITNNDLTVVLTAYNDEASIYPAVMEFYSSPFVKRVIVVSNNSTDGTVREAQRAGAIVYNEELQGYGACVHRALTEGCRYEDTNLLLLCEGDMTFRASDIPKFLSYAPHADVVNGTRIVEQLQENETQLSMFMHYGNLAVGKLLEMKYLGTTTLTDVGTTYKLCRRKPLLALLPLLDRTINLEFNPHFLEQAIRSGLGVIECPITFRTRVGTSKGGNASNYIALKVGIKMIVGILFGWSWTK